MALHTVILCAHHSSSLLVAPASIRVGHLTATTTVGSHIWPSASDVRPRVSYQPGSVCEHDPTRYAYRLSDLAPSPSEWSSSPSTSHRPPTSPIPPVINLHYTQPSPNNTRSVINIDHSQSTPPEAPTTAEAFVEHAASERPRTFSSFPRVPCTDFLRSTAPPPPQGPRVPRMVTPSAPSMLNSRVAEHQLARRTTKRIGLSAQIRTSKTVNRPNKPRISTKNVPNNMNTSNACSKIFPYVNLYCDHCVGQSERLIERFVKTKRPRATIGRAAPTVAGTSKKLEPKIKSL